MDITGVKISLRHDDKLKGFANIILDNAFVIHGLKIIRGLKGYFIAMPSRRRRDGEYTDVAHPICCEFRERMEKIIMDKYWEELGRQGSGEEVMEDSEDSFMALEP